MHRKIFFCVLVTSFYFPIDSGVSSKLDFDENSENEKIIIKNMEHEKITCSSGCNKTGDKTVDGILTDVLVHVKTSVDLSNVKNETKEIPDVPIIIGYGGSTPTNFNSDSLIYSEPMLVTDQYPSNRRIDGDFVSNKPYFYPRPELNRNSNPQFTPTKYNDHVSNLNYLKIPYFETSFHKHNYGEQPPPQFAWYPKGGVSFNPLEFKTFRKPVWNTMQWNRSPHYNQQTTPGHTTCTCQNSGLKWYPTTPTWSLNDGSKIDDKIAPLN